MASNSFDGHIREFPGIGADKFNIGCEIYLLTHAHKDHLVGLDRVSFNSHVYCSETTKRLVASELRYRNKAHLLRPLQYNIVHEIETGDGEIINVVLIPSYHCPGSVAFLVYDSRKAILFTGDVKAESWWIDLCLRNSPHLYPYIVGSKCLECIYFDSSFASRGEPYIEIPHNDIGIRGAIALLQQYPTDDSDVGFCFRDSILGFEECWAKVAQALDWNIKLPPTLETRLKRSDSGSDPIYGAWIRSVAKSIKANKDTGSIGVYLKENSPKKTPKFNVGLQQCIDFNLPDLLAHFWPISYGRVADDRDLKLVDTTIKGHQIFEYRGRKWLKPKGQSVLLPANIKIVFSRHSSFSETRELIQCFCPKQVYPCLFSRSTWKNGFSMKRLFHAYCTGRDFMFDEEMRSLYGSHTVRREVVTIDRWDVSDCQAELEFVLGHKDVGAIKLYDFIGQKPYSNGQKRKRRRLTDTRPINLEAVISGRNEERYKKWVEEQQAIYRGIESSEAGMHRILNYENQSENSNSNSLNSLSQTGTTLSGMTKSEVPFNARRSNAMASDESGPIEIKSESSESDSILFKDHTVGESPTDIKQQATAQVTKQHSKIQKSTLKRPRLIRRNSNQEKQSNIGHNLRSSFSSLESSFAVSHTTRTSNSGLDNNALKRSYVSLSEDHKKWFTMSLDSVWFSKSLRSCINS